MLCTLDLSAQNKRVSHFVFCLHSKGRLAKFQPIQVIHLKLGKIKTTKIVMFCLNSKKTESLSTKAFINIYIFKKLFNINM